MKRLAATVLVLSACGDDGGMTVMADARMVDANPNKVQTVTCPTAPAANIMTVVNTDAYLPSSTVTISVNEIVKFDISGGHDVTPNPLTNSDPGLAVEDGEVKCLQFTQTGMYGFYCTPHGFTGTITVQ